MAREQLNRYRCDQCEEEVITDKVPRGWVRILSSKGRDGSMTHHGSPPVLWTPIASKTLPDKAYWCSPSCLADWVLEKANEIVAQAKLKPR